MKLVYVVGAGQNSATRAARVRSGMKRRRVRFGPGGMFMARVGRRLPLSMKQFEMCKNELAMLVERGMVMVVDGNGRIVDNLFDERSEPESPATGDGETVEESPESEVSGSDEDDEDESTDEPEATSDEEPPASEPEETTEEPEETTAPDYESMEYGDLRSLAADRNIDLPSRKKEDIIAALIAADEAGGE